MHRRHAELDVADRSWRRLTTIVRRRLTATAIAALIAQGALMGVLVGPVIAATTVNLDQWASLDFAWQNGNLNGNNSRYPEGGVVPFRLALEGLAPGSHEIRISHDFTAGGHKAYDFLATWNVTHGAGGICSPSGGAISSMCPALPTASTYPFPSDPFVTDGLSVAGAQAYAGISRRLWLWGGTITSITSPVHSGSASGNSSVELVVRFKANGPAVLLAWGGHLAQSSYWNSAGGGGRDGASLVSGAPWHMRTLGLDGAGSKNQDRSIQPSAIVGELPPGGVPTATRPPAVPSLGPPLIDVTPPPTASATTREPRGAPSSLGFLTLLVVGGLYLMAATRPWRRRSALGRARPRIEVQGLADLEQPHDVGPRQETDEAPVVDDRQLFELTLGERVDRRP